MIILHFHNGLSDRRPITSQLNWPIRSINRVKYHQLTRHNSLWPWRWLPQRLSKRQSLSTTALFGTSLTRTMMFHLIIKVIVLYYGVACERRRISSCRFCHFLREKQRPEMESVHNLHPPPPPPPPPPSPSETPSLQILFNPLSPNIHIEILQTDPHTFPLRISWENLIKHHGIFSLVIISLIRIT